jgi:hypothetical protein
MKGILPAVFVLLALSACNKTAAPTSTGSAATVMLKDGSSFSGTVTKSDTSSITLQSSTGESRTYPMAQVTSVQYGPAPNADQQPAPAVQAANTPPPPPSYSAAPAPAPAPEPAAPVAAPAPQYQPADDFRTIPAGTTIEVRNNQTISSEAAAPGQTYSAVVVRNVTDTAGRVAIPHGAGATLVIHEARRQGEMQGRSELVFDVGSVNVDGRTYRLETSDFVEKGKEGLGENRRTGKFLGGGAALGGIIGAIAGGGKGAAIGALSGAGAGVATQGLTRGHAVRVPAETVMAFRLEAPIRIREMR